MIPLLDAGALDRRVTVLRPLFNEWNDEITGWEEVATVWASVAPATFRSREIVEAGRTVALGFVDISIRYRADVDQRCRIRDREQEYEIQSVVDVLRRHVRLDLACVEVV